MSEFRYVLDTNVLVSGVLIAESVPDRAFQLMRRTGVILFSETTLAEVQVVLNRPKFDRYVTRVLRSQFLAALSAEAELIPIVETIQECRDPKDDKFLEVAVNGRATCLVTGDQDLLELHPFRNIPIMSPSEFIQWQEGLGTGSN